MSNGRVTLLPSGQAFEVKPDEFILDAALRQGISVTYTCRNGTCRTCIFQVCEGIVVQENLEECMLSEQELALNRRLICMATLKTDAVLEKLLPRRKRDPL